MLSEFEIGELVPGTSYRVISCIGQGGMGSVYEVEHRELGKRFVVKALLREFVGRVDLVQRLRNEWRALGQLEHPHIVSVSDAGVSTNGVPFYVMERLNGETLADRIKRQGRLEVTEALRIAVEVLDALTAAHAIGVVHRDIKPPNIFLTRSGASKILDFGIAKLLDGTAAITGRGVAIGTPRYMSPEQASGERIDARADLYAVGLVLFEMLSGQSPFEGASAQEVFLAHVTKPAPNIMGIVPTVPHELASVIAKLLEKKPADRIRSAKRTAESLRQILRGFAPATSDTEVAPLTSALTPMFGIDSARMPPSLDAWTISENGPTHSARPSAPPAAARQGLEDDEFSVSAVPTEVLTHGDSVPPTRTSVPAGAAPGAAPSPAPWGLTPLPQFRGYSPAERRALLRWGGLGVAVAAVAVFVRMSWAPVAAAPGSSAVVANGAPLHPEPNRGANPAAHGNASADGRATDNSAGQQDSTRPDPAAGAGAVTRASGANASEGTGSDPARPGATGSAPRSAKGERAIGGGAVSEPSKSDPVGTGEGTPVSESSAGRGAQEAMPNNGEEPPGPARSEAGAESDEQGVRRSRPRSPEESQFGRRLPGSGL